MRIDEIDKCHAELLACTTIAAMEDVVDWYFPNVPPNPFKPGSFRIAYDRIVQRLGGQMVQEERRVEHEERKGPTWDDIED